MNSGPNISETMAISFRRMLSDGPEVSLNGSPTVSPVTAATFSLLPARNSSGNYTKVAQLVPVKIALQNDFLPIFPGASVNVKIYVAGQDGG